MESETKINFEKKYYTLLHEYDEFKAIFTTLSREHLISNNNCKSKEELMYVKFIFIKQLSF
jgi:hypothetical protein